MTASESPVRWGILATGSIAHKFAHDLALAPGNEVTAVGSRSVESAQDFARQYGPEVRAHGSYADLAADPDIDVVYVATPHARHVADVELCLDAGKAVLCEKPLTLDEPSARALIDDAARRGLFLAEAMWMRANPTIRHAKALVAEGRLGRVGELRAALGFVAGAKDRLWDPALGASALLDVGIYPVTLAHLVLGEPDEITAAVVRHERGFDLAGGATLTYAGGAVASVAWSQQTWSDSRASISGDGGRIEIPGPFHHSERLEYAYGMEAQTHEHPLAGNGFVPEIEEVAACLRARRTTSDVLSSDDTLAVMRLLGEIAAVAGG